jgi:hypothetical protein
MRTLILCLAGGAIVVALSGPACAESVQIAQYYGYPPPGYARPPCYAVTPGPLQGAARGAAGGAIFGAIGGNAGKGAAIGAGVGGVAGAIRRGSARSSGACY